MSSSVRGTCQVLYRAGQSNIIKMLLACLLLASLALGAQASVSGIVDVAGKDREKLLTALTTGFVKLQPGDVDSVYYGARGFELLKESLVAVLAKDSCAYISAHFKHGAAPENVFHALAAHKILKCEGKLHTDATINALKPFLEKPASTADVRYALEALQLLGQSIPNPAKVSQVLQQKLKEDDSLQSLGNALHAASLLGAHGKFASDRIEDAVVQADEVDGKLLQWEGGLTVTSLLLTGLFKLPNAKPLNQDQAEKFGSYLLTRRSVQTAKGALALIEATLALTSSNVSPVSISLISNTPVTVEKPDLKIRVSDLLGNPLKPAPAPVVAQSATRVTDDVVVLSKQTLTQGGSATEFVLPLRLEPGQYRVALTAGSHSTSVQTRVLGPINIQSLEIGTGDADGSSAPKLVKLQHPGKLSTALQADANQNLIGKFSLTRPVHQAFVRLHSGKKEIIFIAEKDSSQVYKLNVNLAAELTSSGIYNIELILGDAIMSNPIRWDLGVIDVSLATSDAATAKVTRGPKPEIQHMFRQPDKRPPQAVSLFFTAAVAVPLLILLILWAKIGVPMQFSNFYSLPFHLGYAGILALYTYFWLCGNMFSTCAYLLYIGGFTFIAGNRMLRKIASSKK